VGILIAREDTLEIQDGEAAVLTHLDGEARADHAVHGGGDDRDLEAMAAEVPGNVDLAGIDGQRSGDQRDVIETVRRPRLPPPSHPHPHAVVLPSTAARDGRPGPDI